MRRRITDLFKKIYNGIKGIIRKYKTPKYENVVEKQFIPKRTKTRSRWLIHHNSIQAKNANQLKKRRAKNKVAKQSRKINHRKAA